MANKHLIWAATLKQLKSDYENEINKFIKFKLLRKYRRFKRRLFREIDCWDYQDDSSQIKIKNFRKHYHKAYYFLSTGTYLKKILLYLSICRYQGQDAIQIGADEKTHCVDDHKARDNQSCNVFMNIASIQYSKNTILDRIIFYLNVLYGLYNLRKLEYETEKFEKFISSNFFNKERPIKMDKDIQRDIDDCGVISNCLKYIQGYSNVLQALLKGCSSSNDGSGGYGENIQVLILDRFYGCKFCMLCKKMINKKMIKFHQQSIRHKRISNRLFLVKKHEPYESAVKKGFIKRIFDELKSTSSSEASSEACDLDSYRCQVCLQGFTEEKEYMDHFHGNSHLAKLNELGVSEELDKYYGVFTLRGVIRMRAKLYKAESRKGLHVNSTKYESN